jgi:hypothetical protein
VSGRHPWPPPSKRGLSAGDTGFSSIQTFTGRFVEPLNVIATDVDIRDVAHALSNVCRFQGHVRDFYSVAQHCVLCAGLVPLRHALAALLHDAPETYLCDLAGPVKRDTELGLMYKAMEERTAWAIEDAFLLPRHSLEHEHVKNADWAILQVEGRQLMPANGWARADILPGMLIEPWAPKRAEREYLATFGVLVA